MGDRSEGAGRRALREYFAKELATASQEIREADDWGALPPTYSGNCHCGRPYWRDEKLCRKHARERLATLGIGAK